MPYEIRKGTGNCPGGKPFAVVGPTGRVHGCHSTKDKAKAQMRALYANEPKAKTASVIQEAQRLSSGNEVSQMVAAKLQERATVPTEDNDMPEKQEALIIDSAPCEECEEKNIGTITVSASGAVAALADQLEDAPDNIKEAFKLFSEYLNDDGEPVAAGGPVKENAITVGEAGPEMFIPANSGYIQSNNTSNGTLNITNTDVTNSTGDWITNTVPGTANGTTKVRVNKNGEITLTQSRLLAAAWQPPADPDVSWFENPALTAATPLTVTDEGRVFGHIALWGTCHVGQQASCVEPPRSKSNYSFYRTGLVRLADAEIPVGSITIGTGHASLQADAYSAASHYDNTGTAVADVASGEDDYGIWIAGMVRPGVSLEQVHALQASALSGDWRQIGGNLELVAVLAVNVPGFPVPRSLAASAYEINDEGKVTALVATGQQGMTAAQMNAWMESMETRIKAIENTTRILRPIAASAFLKKVQSNGSGEAAESAVK